MGSRLSLHEEPDFAVVRSLFWKWDFAGLTDRAAASGEYDVISEQFLLHLRRSPDAARAWLTRELSENWALTIPAWAIDGFVDEAQTEAGGR